MPQLHWFSGSNIVLASHQTCSPSASISSFPALGAPLYLYPPGWGWPVNKIVWKKRELFQISIQWNREWGPTFKKILSFMSTSSVKAPNGDDWIKPKTKDNCLIESTCSVIFSKWGSAARDPHSRSLKRALIQQTYSGIWSCTLKKYARLFDGWFKTVCLVGLPKEMLWNSQDWVFSHQGQIFKQMSRKTRL